MKKLYYTDPIQALYMMQTFDIQLKDGYHFQDWHFEATMPGELNREYAFKNWPERIYVAKESLSIFKPKEGDEGRHATRLGACFSRYDGKQWVGHGVNQEGEPSIIMRGGKHFFNPLEE